MSNLTEYGKLIKHRLIDLGMSQNSLIEEVSAKSGMYCDYSVIKRVITGQAVHENIISAINEILDIN